MTPHFSKESVACKCGCGLLPEQPFMNRIEMLRNSCGFPLVVTSGARCPSYNAKVSSTGENGPHTTGRAIDLGVSRKQAYTVVKKALELGFTGIGIQQKGASRFIHIDDLADAPNQPRPTIWSY
jgi:uncharacterized protein YcbK (DUF882 family)